MNQKSIATNTLQLKVQHSYTPSRNYTTSRTVTLSCAPASLPRPLTCELLQRALGVLGLCPQVGGQEAIGVAESIEGGLHKVTQGLAATTGRCAQQSGHQKQQQLSDYQTPRDQAKHASTCNEPCSRAPCATSVQALLRGQQPMPASVVHSW
jgi:hypothetical protein